MNKAKRIKYGIRKLKKAGFSYIDIGQKIRRFKTVSFSTESSTKRSWFKRLINLIKKIYAWFKKIV